MSIKKRVSFGKNIVYPKKRKVLIPIVNTKTDCYVSKAGSDASASPPEKRIAKVLKLYKIKFIQECSFKKFGHPFSPYRFDFFLPDHNVIIEYDGKYHSLAGARKNDKVKNTFCRKNKIKIVRFNKKHYANLEAFVKRVCKFLTKKILK